MKTLSIALLASGAMLGGCAVVPLEPYGPPVAAYGPPPVVVVKPGPRYPRYYYGGHAYRYWR